MQINRNNFAHFFRADFVLVSVYFMTAAEQVGKGVTNPTVKSYTYKVPKSWNVKIGDLLIVNTAGDIDTITSFPVVRVVNVNAEPEIEGEKSITFKWVVAKFDDVVKEYNANLLKDYKLKKALSTLEAKLEQMTLRKMINELMGELSGDDKLELQDLFGTELLGPSRISNSIDSGNNETT